MPPRPPSDLRRTALAALVVLIPAVLCFYGWGIATGRRLFFTHDLNGSDLWHLHYPLKCFMAEQLRAGHLPYWCENIGTGFPLLAEGQVGALYPPNLVLFRWLALPVAFNGSILLHVLLAGISAAMLARELGASRGASVLSGVVFSFSGFLTVHLKHVNMDAAAAWSPLLLLLVERYARSRRVTTAVLAVVVVAAMALAGHPQIAYYNLLIGAVYAVVRAARPWASEGEARFSWSDSTRLGAGLVLAASLGLALAAPQILATLELNRLGPRGGGLTFRDAFEYELTPIELVTFVAPKVFGDPGSLREVTGVDPLTGQAVTRLRGFSPPPGAKSLFWEITGYVGLLPLGVAAVGAVAWRRRREAQPILAVLGVALWLALGTRGGLAPLFYFVVPGFRYFRFQGRFLLYVDLALAVLAGLGLTALIDGANKLRRPRLATTVMVAAIGLSFLDLRHALGDQNPTIETPRWTRPPDTIERIVHEQAGRSEPYRISDVDPGNAVFANAYRRARGWDGDLAPYDVAQRLSSPNLNELYGVNNINFYFYIYPARLRLAAISVLDAKSEAAGPLRVATKVASLYNIRYFLTAQDSLPGAGTPLAEFPGDSVASDGRPFRIHLIENRDALPRAFLVPKARYVPPVDGLGAKDEERSIALLQDPHFDPSSEVLIEGEPDPTDPAGDETDLPIRGGVTFVSYEPQRVHLDVRAPRACWLFLSDTWYPGWKAEIDGRPTRIRAADVSGRALVVPAGEHQVVFSYRPPYVLRGWLVAAAAALAAGSWLGGSWWRGRMNPDWTVR
jgi:hypothetical protein